jgi:dTDP-4-amino-4,6-dideoxygalactose transaminase
VNKIGVGEVRLSAQAKANVLDVLETNRLSYGPYSRRFERDFAKLHHRDFACFVNSGTDALRIGLAAMKEHYGWKDGDQVIVPALTFVSSLNVIVQNGLKPILVDVDPDFYDMRFPSAAIAQSRPPAVAIMPVALFGQPLLPSFTALARGFDLKVIEDSCETMFVGWSHADVTCYSTYACHLINTGVGGLATTNEPELAVLIRSIANHGRSGIYTGIDQVLAQREVMDARFQFDRIGYSARATEMEAAIGCAELDDWEANLLTRRRNARHLRLALADLPLQMPKERVPGQHSYMMFPIVCDDSVDRDQLTQHLEGHGIETRPMLPLTNQPYVKKLFGDDVEDRFPVAKRINRQGFYIGCHQHLDQSDLAHIYDAFRQFFV